MLLKYIVHQKYSFQVSNILSKYIFKILSIKKYSIQILKKTLISKINIFTKTESIIRIML